MVSTQTNIIRKSEHERDVPPRHPDILGLRTEHLHDFVLDYVHGRLSSHLDRLEESYEEVVHQRHV